MCQELGLDRQTGAFSLSDGLVQAQGTQLQGKAETVVWPAALADVFQVVVG